MMSNETSKIHVCAAHYAMNLGGMAVSVDEIARKTSSILVGMTAKQCLDLFMLDDSLADITAAECAEWLRDLPDKITIIELSQLKTLILKIASLKSAQAMLSELEFKIDFECSASIQRYNEILAPVALTDLMLPNALKSNEILIQKQALVESELDKSQQAVRQMIKVLHGRFLRLFSELMSWLNQYAICADEALQMRHKIEVEKNKHQAHLCASVTQGPSILREEKISFAFQKLGFDDNTLQQLNGFFSIDWGFLSSDQHQAFYFMRDVLNHEKKESFYITDLRDGPYQSLKPCKKVRFNQLVKLFCKRKNISVSTFPWLQVGLSLISLSIFISGVVVAVCFNVINPVLTVVSTLLSIVLPLIIYLSYHQFARGDVSLCQTFSNWILQHHYDYSSSQNILPEPQKIEDNMERLVLDTYRSDEAVETEGVRPVLLAV